MSTPAYQAPTNQIQLVIVLLPYSLYALAKPFYASPAFLTVRLMALLTFFMYLPSP
jgi:hypothetical protein